MTKETEETGPGRMQVKRSAAAACCVSVLPCLVCTDSPGFPLSTKHGGALLRRFPPGDVRADSSTEKSVGKKRGV